MDDILMYESDEIECDDMNLDTKGTIMYYNLLVYVFCIISE